MSLTVAYKLYRTRRSRSRPLDTLALTCAISTSTRPSASPTEAEVPALALLESRRIWHLFFPAIP